MKWELWLALIITNAVFRANLPNPDNRSSQRMAMNPEQPRGTRHSRSHLTTNISPEEYDSVLTTSPTTDRVTENPDSSPDTPALSIHQSGPHASITIQGPYNDVGRDQYETFVGGRL